RMLAHEARLCRGDAHKDVMPLSHAVRHACRPGLPDVRRFDLEDPIIAHRSHAIPAGTTGDRRLLHLLAAPRREDYLRIAFRDVGWIDDAILREPRIVQFRKDRRAAGDLDEFLDPSDAGDQRLVPLFEERPKPDRKS